MYSWKSVMPLFLNGRLQFNNTESKTKECANFKFEVKSSVKIMNGYLNIKLSQF